MGEIRKTIEKNIRAVCSLKGIRQVDIAEKLGVSQGTVSNWFKGVNSIDIENLALLCEYIGVSLDQIYGVEPINPSVTLSQEEMELLQEYRSMNKENKGFVLTLVKKLAGNPETQEGLTTKKEIS